MKLWNSVFLSNYFLIALGAIAAIFVVSYFIPAFQVLGFVLLLLFFLVFVIDFALLFYKKDPIQLTRETSERFSNFDFNIIYISIENNYPFQTQLNIIDEIPYQFNRRDFSIPTSVSAESAKTIEYKLKPTLRGEYQFGNVNLMIASPIGILKRKIVFEIPQTVEVYPSFFHLNKYDLSNFKYNTLELGIKKTRTIGQSTEFEQIKEYVKGDDYRHINWKSSAKRSNLMVNQYVDEKSQQVINVIDTGRSMQMPFNGLSLLDYAINATLAFSKVIIKNQDKAGVVYFNKKIEKILPPNRSNNQMGLILNTLFKIQTDFKESDFGNLYAGLKQNLSHRSLIILYTNFEDINALNRQMKYLKGIAKSHVLIVVFFKNAEVEALIKTASVTNYDYYYKSVAEKFSYQKRLILRELEKNGIQAILTEPRQLTLNTINKYLEVKAKGMI